MSKEKQLVKNTAIVAVGKICTQFISFLLLPLYTAKLTTEEFGTVDLLNTYVALLIPLIILQIEQAAFRYLIDARKEEKQKKKIISTTVIVAFVQSILFLIIYAIAGQFIDNPYKYFLATNVVACTFSAIMLQIARGLGDNKTYSIGSLVSAVSIIFFNILFIVVFKWGAYGMLTATFIANMACSIYIIVKKRLYKYISISGYSRATRKTLWKYSIPLVPNALSWWIVNASDRTIISTMLNIGENGIYSAANKFSSICIAVFNVFNLTWTESASMYVKEKDSSKYFSNIMNITLRLFSAVCVGIVAFMPFVFPLLVNVNFDSAYYQIPILMMAALCTIIVSMLGAIYVAKKKTKEIAKTSVMAAIINIVVNVALIKYIGLYAASISTFVAYFAMAVYRLIDVKKYVRLRIDKRIWITTIMISVIVFATYYTRNLYLCAVSAILTVLYAYLNNRRTIGVVINTVLRRIKPENIDTPQ